MNCPRTLSALSSLVLTTMPAIAEEFGGVDFPNGAVSFADAVVAATPGNPHAANDNFLDPLETIGPPNYSGGAGGAGAYTLGHAGSVTVEFRDNRLTGDGTTKADLYIFEVGPFTEPTFVLISELGHNYIPVGRVAGSTSSVDIDPFITATPNKSFRFVRLVDDPTDSSAGVTPGADIDAVGAIATRKPTPQEANIDSRGRRAQTFVQSLDFEEDPNEKWIVYLIEFNGTVVPGYCYTIDFSLNLTEWIPIETVQASDFTPLGGSRGSLICVDIRGFLFDALGSTYAEVSRKGFFRIQIIEKPGP